MELRVTMCPVPSTSRPRAAPLRVPASGCTHPHELARDAGLSRPSVHVPVPSTLALVLSCPCLHPGAADPACPCPLPSLAGAISWGVAGTRLGAGGGSASAGSCSWGGHRRCPQLSQSTDPSPALSPAPGPCWTCLHPAFHVRLLSRSSVSLLFLPFLLFLLRHTGLFIVSAKKLLTRVCGGARIRPLLIFTLNN